MGESPQTPQKSASGKLPQKSAGLRLTDIHVSLLSRKNTAALARSGERALLACRTAQLAFCLSAVVPAFAEPDIHSLSWARRPSQKIECVFSASPETVRREPREFHLRCSVGQWRDLAVCALCDPGDFLFVGLVFRPRRICNLLQARNPVVLDPRREDMRPSCALPQASLDWRSLSVSLFHRATQDPDPVVAPTSQPRSAQIGYSCCAVWKSGCESTSRLSFFRRRRARNN